MPRLFAFERGESGAPIVFLHGFGLSHVCWDQVFGLLPPEHRLIAYDLPGHGKSCGVPHGSAAVAAKAGLLDLAKRDIARVHLVGHSMGGAVASIVALRDTDRVASLTLLAPGGFTPAIAGNILRQYGTATEEAELAQLLPTFFSEKHPPSPGLARAIAKERQAAGATQALSEIADTFFDGTAQKLLPLDALARLPLPKTVVWGRADRILPPPRVDTIPAALRPQMLEGVGHMLPLEVPAAVAGFVMAAGL